MIRKANRYGCDTTYDEGSGRLQVTYNGQHLMDVDVRGHLYYTARDPPDEDVEDMRSLRITITSLCATENMWKPTKRHLR